MTNFSDVGDFHEKFGLHAVRDGFGQRSGSGPQDCPDDLIEFRVKFLQEELDEYMKARSEGDVAGQFDALIDLVYVALGTAHMQGFPWEAGWRRVQEANMAKVRAAKDGSDSARGSAWDVVKPEGWQPPDIAGLLRSYGFDA